MTPDPRSDVTIGDVLRASLWEATSREMMEVSPLAKELLAGRKPTLIVVEKETRR